MKNLWPSPRKQLTNAWQIAQGKLPWWAGRGGSPEPEPEPIVTATEEETTSRRTTWKWGR
jgi:hypothetical protein